MGIETSRAEGACLGVGGGLIILFEANDSMSTSLIDRTLTLFPPIPSKANDSYLELDRVLWLMTPTNDLMIEIPMIDCRPTLHNRLYKATYS
jgi:hypothetical protein